MTFALRKLALAAALAAIGAAQASTADHQEFEATLHAPYRAAAGANEARSFTLEFSFPHTLSAQSVSWVLEVVAPNGSVVERWAGVERLQDKPVTVNVDWAGRNRRNALPNGIYKARLRAMTENAGGSIASGTDAVVRRVNGFKGDVEVQEWDIAVGQQQQLQAKAAAAPMAMMAAAPATLPYTVYFGNMHSQTNHSDGGGNLSSCTGAQNPQSAAYGPTDAFNFAKSHGLDFLMASEHNHMYDGSDSTNTSANPATAKALYQSGLSEAANFNAANPNFLAIYGLEWGVINNGGHMNILNSTELLGWESNSSGQLIADTYTAKNDYAGLYTLMRQRGWLGQFNHPSSSGQFLVNGVALGYTADGDEAMALCEVMNTSAFSTNTTETETSRSNYEGACKKALEAGYHVAFSTDQDNHCANWGASYTNRTGVLIPNGTPLGSAAFMDAIRARRVFATMDKTSQLVLTANGHMMGERFTNNGALNLVADFSSTSGKTVSTVEVYEGVPGRNGTVTLLSNTANTTITPADGAHFYYAKVTQNDGNILWSAPVWVTQGGGGGDTTAPAVSASSSGTSGTVTFNATASDDVGVTKVEFYVDGALKATDTASPWTYAFNSSAVANGSHVLTAKAYDAAGNSTLSAPVNFSVNNATAQQLLQNSGFESGATVWSASSGVITNDASVAGHGGNWKAWLNGYGSAHTDTLYQQVAIPANASSATLGFWLQIPSDETTTTQAYDTLKIQVRNSSGAVLSTLATYSNLNKGTSYVQRTFDLSAYKGQTVRIYFEGVEGSTVATSFILDDITLNVQ
ncbi:CehA/McbA family metallohydrolase [Pseudoduganella violaceinigra]|uniref:CehA/McbA family metallohydrolase n=1 Tax=Pseudoduganella violaceinigra TaxID=246602 RepID=UPI00041FE5C0|nr:CehA/McbA family metallohydrolase [Pseudoduganella violaceinigra]